MESDPTHPEVEITGTSRKRKMPNKFQKGRKSHCVEQETLPASPSSTSSGPPPPPPPPPPFTKISSYNTRLTKLGGPPPPPPPRVIRPKHQTPEPVLRDLAGLSKEKWVNVIEPMAEENARKLIPKVRGWNLISENGLSKLEKTWMVASIPNLLKMFKIIGHVKEDRHLEIDVVGWEIVTIGIWTPGVGGLTKNDFILAAKINAIDMKHLMRPKFRIDGKDFWVKCRF